MLGHQGPHDLLLAERQQVGLPRRVVGPPAALRVEAALRLAQGLGVVVGLLGGAEHARVLALAEGVVGRLVVAVLDARDHGRHEHVLGGLRVLARPLVERARDGVDRRDAPVGQLHDGPVDEVRGRGLEHARRALGRRGGDAAKRRAELLHAPVHALMHGRRRARGLRPHDVVARVVEAGKVGLRRALGGERDLARVEAERRHGRALRRDPRPQELIGLRLIHDGPPARVRVAAHRLVRRGQAHGPHALAVAWLRVGAHVGAVGRVVAPRHGEVVVAGEVGAGRDGLVAPAEELRDGVEEAHQNQIVSVSAGGALPPYRSSMMSAALSMFCAHPRSSRADRPTGPSMWIAPQSWQVPMTAKDAQRRSRAASVISLMSMP